MTEPTTLPFRPSKPIVTIEYVRFGWDIVVIDEHGHRSVWGEAGTIGPALACAATMSDRTGWRLCREGPARGLTLRFSGGPALEHWGLLPARRWTADLRRGEHGRARRYPAARRQLAAKRQAPSRGVGRKKPYTRRQTARIVPHQPTHRTLVGFRH